MRPLLLLHPFILTVAFALALLLAPASAHAKSPQVKVVKVLPHFLDLQGRHSINPSLLDRDAYQFELRRDPAKRSGLRFDVLWKSSSKAPDRLTLKAELRGSKAPAQEPVVLTVEVSNTRGFARWTRIPVLGPAYESLGDLTAWRVSLWDGESLVAELHSFLW